MRKFVDNNDEKIKSVEHELLDMLKSENTKLKRDIRQANQRVESLESEVESLKFTVWGFYKSLKWFDSKRNP